ncbi:MAG: tetratricopeptide repeat protein [Prevotellaceae bacterium]|jgi:tetratricopeptide (TPR) repeat protein|nr:tetratricopeptide repeat protein [Prevotellaceae bacterium]
MNIKQLFIGAIISTVSLTAMAQSNLGVDYFSLGEYILSKNYFTQTLQQNPAESYYYLGEIAFKEGHLDEARDNYERSLAANPESLATVGLAKLQLQSNPAEAIQAMNNYQKKYKKDIKVILAIAQAYYDNDMPVEGAKKVAEARKVNKQSPLIFVFEGDRLEKEQKFGEAATQYDQAILFDGLCLIAYIKGALVYANYTGDATLPVEYLNKVIQLDASYIIAHKYLGKVYTRTGFYLKAIDAYKVYFDAGNHSLEDITLYASANYFGKVYDEALHAIGLGLQQDVNHFVLNRLKMYCYHDMADYGNGLAAGEYFFGITRPDTAKYLVRDHEYYSDILFHVGLKADGVAELNKAWQLQTNKQDASKRYAALCAGVERYADAIDFLERYFETIGIDATLEDNLLLGRYYYMAGAENIKDSVLAVQELSKNYLLKADSVFATIATTLPDNFMGYFWRARSNSSLDPETTAGLAKPFYEKTIEVILAQDPTRTRELTEAYSYLSYYHYLQYYAHKNNEDKLKVKEYAERILEIDPNNQTGKTLLDFAIK